jgi:signal transduction histidine kinase/CheY-like chemotaxis protein
MLERFGLKPYEDPAVEAAFQEHYFQHGQRLVLVLCFLVVFLAGSTFLRDIFLANPDTYVAGKQVLRLAVCAASICIFIILYRSKDLSIANFKLLQLVLAGVVVSACFLLFFFLAEPYTDEAFARNNSTITIALIAVCTLLRLPLSLLFCVMALLFFGMAYATWGFFQTNPRVWIQGQIFLFSGFMLGFLTHTTNRWNERRLFELQRKLDAQLNIEAENNLKKTKFIAALSHDLRQPLTGLIGYLELAEKKIKAHADPDAFEYIQRAQSSATAINTNLKRVLELARIQDIAYHVGNQAVDLQEVVRLIGQLYAAQVIAQNVSLKLVTPSASAYVLSDFDLLFQILQNLVSNSFKYRRPQPTKSRIILSFTQLSAGYTKISIVDNGVGVKLTELDKIFEPYYQGEKPKCSEDKGLGLGLSFVQEAIYRLPHHKICVWSNGCSITKVNIWLPTATAVAELRLDQAKPSATAWSNVDIKALRILLIEDEPSVRNFIKTALKPEVGSIIEVVDFTEMTLSTIHNYPFDFIVSDYNLSTDVTGLRLVIQLQAQTRQVIPALIVSAQNEIRIPENQPLISSLQKPFSANQLLSAIRELTNRRNNLLTKL